MSQKRVGVIISYLNLLMGMVSNVFLVPFLIASLGDVDYSLYKVMQSFAGPLSMFHLGISTIVTRSIVKFNNSENYTEKEKKNTMALALLASVFMSLFVVIAGIVMCCLLPSIYGEQYTDVNIAIGQRIFIIFVLSSVFHMLTDAFSGCLVGHEKFVVSSLLPLMKSVLKIILYIVFLKCGFGVVSVAIVDLIIAVSTFVIALWYATIVLKERPKLYRFDKRQIIEIISFGTAVLLQAFVNQVNNNVDTMILGMYIEEKRIITMYSSALAIYGIYNSLISVVTNYFLPQATKLVTRNASGKELTDFVIRPGRLQAVIAVACIGGFTLFGRNFITIWIGPKYLDAYWIILMLMIPVTVPLVENAMISVLDASLKRIYRSTVLVVMAVINVIVSIFLVKIMGFWGAALGTVASLIIGHGFLMNIYYAKTFNIEIGRMFASIFKGILLAGLFAVVSCLPLAMFVPNTLLLFILKCVSFLVVYAAFLWLFGLNKSEKVAVKGVVKKFLFPKNKLI